MEAVVDPEAVTLAVIAVDSADCPMLAEDLEVAMVEAISEVTVEAPAAVAVVVVDSMAIAVDHHPTPAEEEVEITTMVSCSSLVIVDERRDNCFCRIKRDSNVSSIVHLEEEFDNGPTTCFPRTFVT